MIPHHTSSRYPRTPDKIPQPISADKPSPSARNTTKVHPSRLKPASSSRIQADSIKEQPPSRLRPSSSRLLPKEQTPRKKVSTKVQGIKLSNSSGEELQKVSHPPPKLVSSPMSKSYQNDIIKSCQREDNNEEADSEKQTTGGRFFKKREAALKAERANYTGVLDTKQEEKDKEEEEEEDEQEQEVDKEEVEEDREEEEHEEKRQTRIHVEGGDLSDIRESSILEFTETSIYTDEETHDDESLMQILAANSHNSRVSGIDEVSFSDPEEDSFSRVNCSKIGDQEDEFFSQSDIKNYPEISLAENGGTDNFNDEGSLCKHSGAVELLGKEDEQQQTPTARNVDTDIDEKQRQRQKKDTCPDNEWKQELSDENLLHITEECDADSFGDGGCDDGQVYTKTEQTEATGGEVNLG